MRDKRMYHIIIEANVNYVDLLVTLDGDRYN
jgi:hypothetical protein